MVERTYTKAEIRDAIEYLATRYCEPTPKFFFGLADDICGCLPNKADDEAKEKEKPDLATTAEVTVNETVPGKYIMVEGELVVMK